MPAVTADTLTLPRIARRTLGDTERPVQQITTGPAGFEGEGFPVVRAFAGVSMRDLDPFVHMDQMGEVDYAPGRAEGHRLAPAPRLRDRHLHDRRHVPAPGQPRRRRRHQQRRDAVDDRRRGHPAHRDPARGARHVRRRVPRPAAVGEPARQGQVQRARATRPSRARARRWSPPPTAARWCASSPARSTGTPARARRTRRSPWRTRRSSRARSCRCRGSRLQRAASTSCPATARSAPSSGRSTGGQLAVFGAGDRLTVAADSGAGLEPSGARGRAARRPADRRAGRALRPVRDEHQGRAHPGDRGLPGRPARRDPRQRPDAAHRLTGTGRAVERPDPSTTTLSRRRRNSSWTARLEQRRKVRVYFFQVNYCRSGAHRLRHSIRRRSQWRSGGDDGRTAAGIARSRRSTDDQSASSRPTARRSARGRLPQQNR